MPCRREELSYMKIAAALSGGVDSSVAAYLLKRDGFDLCGMTFRMLDKDGFLNGGDTPCVTDEDVASARDTAEKLGIPHYLFNYGENFKRDVVDNFVSTYLAGGTPNPCIECNKCVKFGSLLAHAEELGYTHIATGHYARVEYDGGSGRYLLKRAADPAKDQTYVLYTLTQDRLSKIILPLGAYTKDEIRELARENGFKSADKPESQDICFVPDGDYAAFIERYTGKPDVQGDFVDCDGNILGTHKGITHYTVGQGKHLGIAIGRKAFVCDIDPVSRRITLGDNDMLMKSSLDAADVNIIAADSLPDGARVEAKIRYAAKPAPARVWQTGDNSVHVEFDTPQRAITRGQSVVMYDGDTVIGGGKII